MLEASGRSSFNCGLRNSLLGTRTMPLPALPVSTHGPLLLAVVWLAVRTSMFWCCRVLKILGIKVLLSEMGTAQIWFLIPNISTVSYMANSPQNDGGNLHIPKYSHLTCTWTSTY